MFRKSRQGEEMAISERELNQMTAELDMLHNETFPGVKKVLEDFSANVSHLRTSQGLGRRAFLGGLGGVAVIGGVAACSSSGGSGGDSTPPTSPMSTPESMMTSGSAGSPYTGDLKVVALAAALENLAVTAYNGALSAASAGKLGTVPAAIGTFAKTAMMQHQDHSQAWNGVLSKAKLPVIKGAPLTITSDQVAMLNSAKNIGDVAKLALNLENAAAETYTFAATNVTDSGGIMTAATIQPVETMHAAILNFILGQYPVPVSFIGVDKAVQPNALTA